ncbi:hypothetical protein DET50_12132 [Marinobacter pelagius]|uniref:Polysaccharide lyase n=1 Tax=Marinobacter pelagius TaxID=379482 RepID=A0A366GFF5_9GAMM|nr:hypothetical protein [Marinobacter pelagius]RBP25690.1 hypothetical protein DET50_12132 [Marinobacter pelagius]
MNFPKYFNTLSISLVTALTFSSVSISAPKIAVIDGEIRNGSSITIQGSEFGELPSDYRSLWDTVDNQTVFNDLPDGTPVPEDKGPWSRNGSAWANPMSLAKETGHRHAYTSAHYFGKEKAFIGVPRAFNNSTNRNIYVSWWFYSSYDIDQYEGHNKLIRIWDDLDGTQTRISWTQVLLGAYGDASWANWGGVAGTWNKLEIYANADQGTIDTWTNGRKIHSVSNYEKQSVSDGMTVWLIGFDPNYDVYKNLEIRLDDIFVASSPARVELSTSATWAGTGKRREIQPFSSWTSKKIEVNINLGQFSEEDNLYFYVIDSSGNVNSEGFALCPQCPKSPSLELN